MKKWYNDPRNTTKILFACVIIAGLAFAVAAFL